MSLGHPPGLQDLLPSLSPLHLCQLVSDPRCRDMIPSAGPQLLARLESVLPSAVHKKLFI